MGDSTSQCCTIRALCLPTQTKSNKLRLCMGAAAGRPYRLEKEEPQLTSVQVDTPVTLLFRLGSRSRVVGTAVAVAGCLINQARLRR